MELRHIRYFIAVAECQSFRVAAERIHVTQPAITRQVQDLEAEIGATLFHRNSTGVRLTAAGEHFLREARVALSVLNDATHSAARIAAGLEGSLRIGFVENASWDGLVPDAFARFQEDAPKIQLSLVPGNTPEHIDGLMNGRVDGAFIYQFDELSSELEIIVLSPKIGVLALPKIWHERDPLLSMDGPLPLTALAGKPMVIFPRHTYPAYHDYLLERCRQAGLDPIVVQEVTTEAAILSLVSAGVGAAIVNSGNANRPPARVRFVSIQDSEIVIPFAFAFIKRNLTPALARFVKLVVSLKHSDAT